MDSEDIGLAIHSFKSETCPACVGPKTNVFDPFCGECLELLPSDLLVAVTDRSTYIEAFGPSLRTIRLVRSNSDNAVSDEGDTR